MKVFLVIQSLFIFLPAALRIAAAMDIYREDVAVQALGEALLLVEEEENEEL